MGEGAEVWRRREDGADGEDDGAGFLESVGGAIARHLFLSVISILHLLALPRSVKTYIMGDT